MKLPLKTLKALISGRKEAVVHENLTMSDDELDDMNYKGVRPIMMHYVHGGPAPSRSERS